jgi:hypothetical protein
MSDANRRSGGDLSETALKRRGVFAAVWALAAGWMLKWTTQPVEAAVVPVIYSNAPGEFAASIPSTPVYIFNQNNFDSSSSTYGATVLHVVVSNNPNIDAITADAISGGRHGLVGRATSNNAVGVYGQIPSGAANAIAVYGLNNSTYAGPGPGAGGFGVYGLSARGHGLVGATAAAGAAAVVGATNGVAGAYAAAFYGPVVIGGALTVFGAKSAAVPHADGTHRRLYCVESPESWFEDFGKGQLEKGSVVVTIDPDFAAVTDLTDYHVFLTPYGRAALFVVAQTADGFRVESEDSTSAARFSWRVVAKRRDIAAPRFETVTVPPEPTLPGMPPVSDAAPPPRSARR